MYSSLYSVLVQVTDFGVVALTGTIGEKENNKAKKKNFTVFFFILLLFYVFLIFLVVDIIVPNKTSDAPNKKFMFIISLKNKIPHTEPNKTCK